MRGGLNKSLGYLTTVEEALQSEGIHANPVFWEVWCQGKGI